MNKAIVFQEKYTAVQIFVYHCDNMIQAKSKLSILVNYPENWNYIGEKVAVSV